MIPSNGFRIGRLRGIGLYIHWSWFLVFALLLWVVLQFFQVNVESAPSHYIPMSVATTLLFFVSVLLHELSHSMVANRNGIPIRRITLFVFGGVAQMGRDVTSPGAEFKMAIAGPLCSYVLCCLFGLVAYLGYLLQAGTLSFGFALLSAVNFGLGTFNLIPGFPLDGGRILRSLLWRHSGDLEKSTRIASRIGEGVGVALVSAGGIMFLADLIRAPYDLLVAGLWFVFIGIFLIQAASASYSLVHTRVSLAGLKVMDAMRPGVPAVDTSTSLEELYGIHLERAPASTIPVLRQGRLAGVVDLPHAQKVSRDLWPDTPVSQVAVDLDPSHTVSPNEPLFEALMAMEHAGLNYLWVVEEGRLSGVIFLEDARRLAK